MMAKPWSEHRGTITKLYIHEGRTLEDVRNIMKVQHNFEASIRSYRQHFDKWEIGKYNCKKRERRRRQSLTNTMISPPHSPPDMAIKREEMGSPASSSSSMSRRSSEQKPLPILKQPHILYPTYLQQIRPQDDLPAKAENSRESFAGGLDMFRNTQVAQDMFSSSMPLQHYSDSGWQVPRGAPSSYVGSPPTPFYRSSFQDAVPPRCMPEPLLHPRSSELRSGLRAPDLSVGRDNGGPGSMMHPLIGYQSVAQG
ncbi:Ff.00g046700.m01.CDS01 [Fusarium sp. VM40]|nr:Ff.00g046700.m01.CDS01 [Fusarium sp. VM40]